MSMCLRDRMPMAIVRFQRLDEPLPSGFIFAFRGEITRLPNRSANTLTYSCPTNVEFIDPTQHTC